MSQVSLVKIQGLDFKKAIENSLNLLNYRFSSRLKKVVIKPNMCYYWDYSTGETTDPMFVGALIDTIFKHVSPNVEISIVESDASAMKCRHVFKILGYAKLSKEYGVKLVNLSQDKCDTAKVTAGNKSFNLMIPQTIQNTDLKINIPKIKYTSRTGIKITCALKNIFGCNPYAKKFRYHYVLGEAIVAINKAMKFDLSIIDGNIVSGVQSRSLGLVMASRDPVAIDAAAAVIAGINPRTIKYLNLAHREGLGNPSFKTIGEPIDYFRARYPRKNAIQMLKSQAYTFLISTGMNKRLDFG